MNAVLTPAVLSDDEQVGALIRAHQMQQRRLTMWMGVFVAALCGIAAIVLHASPASVATALGFGLFVVTAMLASAARALGHGPKREPSIPVYRRDQWVKRDG